MKSIRLPHLPSWAVWVVGVLGLLLIGGAAGHFVSPRTAGGPVTLPAPTVTDGAVEAGAVRMPDLLGIDLATSRQALTEFGVASRVETRTRAAAGPEGLVVEQDPAPGDKPTDVVTLTLSTPVPMPAVTGKTVATARQGLEALGAVTRIEYVIRPRVKAGTVIATAPAAGKPLGLLAVLTVATEGDGLPLSQYDAEDTASCSSDDDTVTVAGREVNAALACSPGNAEYPAYAEYTLRKRVAYLEAVLGIDDSGDTDTVVVRAIGDGRAIATWTVTASGSQPVRIQLSGVTRLRLVVTSSADRDSRLIFGDARLVGRTEDLAFLENLQ